MTSRGCSHDDEGPSLDRYTTTRREWVEDRAEDTRKAVGELFVCWGRRILGEEHRRVTILNAFDIGYECGWRSAHEPDGTPPRTLDGKPLAVEEVQS